MSEVKLSDLSVADVMALMAQLREAEKKEKEEAKKRRGEMVEYLGTIVPDVLTLFGVKTFAKGAVGQQIGGTVKVTDPATGQPREARVSMLVRWVDTIPAREAKSDADAEGEPTTQD